MKRLKRLTLIATSILLGIGSPAFALITNLTINNVGTVSSDGKKVTVSGAVTCTAGDTFSLSAGAGQQRSDGEFAVAFGSSPPPDMECTGSPQDWTVVLSPIPFSLFPAGDFEPGPARCNVIATGSTDNSVGREIDCVLNSM